jgi:hypothetical protein
MIPTTEERVALANIIVVLVPNIWVTIELNRVFSENEVAILAYWVLSQLPLCSPFQVHNSL